MDMGVGVMTPRGWWRSDLRRCDGSSSNDWIDEGAHRCEVAAGVIAGAESHYVGFVLGRPRLQDPSCTFEDRTVR